ncbi:MAG: PAS domain S-box protein, partial [Spirochaetes bacterium]|nr:PAS domain S-box protein [Spirochaetota bacterium]
GTPPDETHRLFVDRFVTKEGRAIPVEVSARGFSIGGRGYVMAVARDITERVRWEERLRRSLREKEILLAEIHHRVKNNLQVISSLLDMQTYYIQDREVMKHFQATAGRVEAMGLLHKKLYQTSDLERVEMRDYIASLVEKILYMNRVEGREIGYSLDVENVFFNVDTALPCGLLLNEIITNSLKYAFMDRSTGDIGVILEQLGGDSYRMTVSDNGTGLPEGVDFFSNSRLGLQLVYMLTQQLRGEVSIARRGGTIYTIQFAAAGREGVRWH